jgi:hypothetical protein
MLYTWMMTYMRTYVYMFMSIHIYVYDNHHEDSPSYPASPLSIDIDSKVNGYALYVFIYAHINLYVCVYNHI